MRVYCRLLCLLPVILITGCVSSLHAPEIDKLIAASPVVERLTSDTFAPRTAAGSIELFYRDWNAWTRPTTVRDWEHHFVMGAASVPDWRYTAIARVEIYQHELDDARAVEQLRNTAHALGGDAIVKVYREPLIDRNAMPADIVGYRYKGLVVRKN